ncbi:unnamed protein product [Coccothraustes coccothraustes]
MTAQPRAEAGRHRPCARTAAGQEPRGRERSVPSRTGTAALVPPPSPRAAHCLFWEDLDLLSSKECWENRVKLALRFIFCLDKVLGKLFHSQDKCY